MIDEDAQKLLQAGALIVSTKSHSNKKSAVFSSIVTAAIAIVIIVVLFAVGIITPAKRFERKQADIRVEGAGFQSPEDAVSAYMDALSSADYDAMISTCSIETAVENYDLLVDMQWRKVYTRNYGKIPNSNDFNNSINIAQYRHNIEQSIWRQYVTLCYLTYEISDWLDAPSWLLSIPQAFSSDGEVREFYDSLNAELDSEKLSAVKEYRITDAQEFDLKGLLNDEQMKRNIEKQISVLGADELAMLAAIFTAGGEDWIINFDVVRYGEKWWISTPQGTFGTFLGTPLERGGIVRLHELYD
jgi:hypothetical protein